MYCLMTRTVLKNELLGNLNNVGTSEYNYANLYGTAYTKHLCFII